MTMGAGKTYVAVTSTYRQIKFANARRVLFLVDRATLGRQALKEFQAYTTPDDGRKFTELYNVQQLTSNKLDPVARVCISTIQRLYSMLKGQEMDEALDEASLGDLDKVYREPVPVVYNLRCPPEYFDVVLIDECHRSIYTVWRQVLEYFDAFLIGLTATPSKQTLGFFNQNLVTEYGHAQAVADGVNVDHDVYRIRTQITERGSKVEAGLWVDRRDRDTRRVRWEKLDSDLQYASAQLDRDVVAVDQIRTVFHTFKDRLFTDIFPGRKDVPKTLVFAKDDSHADDIVRIAREVFGKGNDFAQKITYRTTGTKPEDLIAAFRTTYNPRIAVTVDMIATGTDVKPLEVVMFLRDVKSRVYFEQMKGRGARVIGATDFQAVTPDAAAKDRFVIVDCVGVTEREEWRDNPNLDREPTIPLEKLFNAVALGNTDPDVASSIAGRLARLDRRLTDDERKAVRGQAGRSLTEMTGRIVAALDPDEHVAEARRAYGIPSDAEPTAEQVAASAEVVIRTALEPLATNADLRQLLLDIKRSKEQTIDAVSKDAVLEAGYSAAAKERAKQLVRSFENFIEENRDHITALQIIYNRPGGQRLTYDAARELAKAIEAPPRQWTTEKLWKAYETLDSSKVRGAPGRILADLVRLVRYAMNQEDELVPHPDMANERFERWLSQQEARGRKFTREQREWLVAIRDHVAANLEVTAQDLDLAPFSQRGGLGKAHRVFGDDLPALLAEVSEVLAA
jgi:type I restriction enzyme R subunit